MSSQNPRRSPRIDVEITEEIIEIAIPRDSSHCMIADAVRVAVPEARNIAVDLATIRFTDPKTQQRYVYLTPRIGQLALIAFDSGEKPAPFRFKLRGAHVMRSGAGRSTRQSLQTVDDLAGLIPERRGGKPPPAAPLAGGAPKNPRSPNAEANRTGRRREFGIRALAR